MLGYAIEFKSELTKSWMKSIDQERNKYFHSSGWVKYSPEIDDNDWNRLQMVSVLECGAVLGYFSCSIDRDCRKACSIQAINFSFKNNRIFAKDLYAFIDSLFTSYGLNKIEWSVIIGNPIEAMYDRAVKQYGGNIYGIAHQTCALKNGMLCDMKYYEIMRCEYMKHRRIREKGAEE